MTAAIKPCPFCGGEAGPGPGRTQARCRSCGAEGPFHVDAAVDAWNRRVPDPALAAAEARAEKAEAELAAWRGGNPSDDLWRVRMEQAEAENARLHTLVAEEARLIAERDHARANLATVQREHDTLVKSTDATRAALAEALGTREWKPLAALVDDVVDLADGLASARAEVARLTAECAARALQDVAAR